MNLWITLRPAPARAIAAPRVCPHAGCGGRRMRLHQHVAKSVLSADGSRSRRTVHGRRYRCARCGRGVCVYPHGIDSGRTAVAIKRLAAALCLLGVSARGASVVLAMIGLPLGKSQLHASVARRVAGLRLRRRPAMLGRVWAAGPGEEGARIAVFGRRLPLRAAVDRHGRPALVIDGVDAQVPAELRQWVHATLAAMGVAVEVEWPGGEGSWGDWRGSGRGRAARVGVALDAGTGHGAGVDPLPPAPAPASGGRGVGMCVTDRPSRGRGMARLRGIRYVLGRRRPGHSRGDARVAVAALGRQPVVEAAPKAPWRVIPCGSTSGIVAAPPLSCQGRLRYGSQISSCTLHPFAAPSRFSPIAG